MTTQTLPEYSAPRLEPPREEAPATPVRPRNARRPFLVLGIVVAVGLAALALYAALNAGYETTDDAQIEASVVPIAPRVGGIVKRVAVAQNTPVKKGDVILEIDDRDLRARLAQAEADLATARAQLDVAQSQERVITAGARGGLAAAEASVDGAAAEARMAEAQVNASEAALQKAQADLGKAEADLARMKELATTGAVAVKELDDAQAARDAAAAEVVRAGAERTATLESRRAADSHVTEEQGKRDASAPVEAQIAAAESQTALARARVAAAEQAVELARLSLSYATITASDDGTASDLEVTEGQLVSPGQPIGELVVNGSYVVANFKETQIGRMKPGDPVTVKVDAFHGKSFDGVVKSLSAGTGARFSLLPPDNATGNFVKVVQRVPVRIEWTDPPAVPLAAGLSANVRVRVK